MGGGESMYRGEGGEKGRVKKGGGEEGAGEMSETQGLGEGEIGEEKGR